jgi:glucokinase
VRLAIGADLGGTKMAVGVIDEQQNILHRGTEPTFGRDLDGLLTELESELREGIAACPEVEAIGLGIPSTIDRRRGVAISSVNLPIVNVPIRDLVGERVDLPVFIDNDANCAALAEQRFGAAKGTSNALMLTVGTGIGGGVIVDGEVYRGTIGSAAELGHVVIDENGPKCQGNCPNHGCVEVMASGTALGKEGRLAAEKHPDSALGRALAAGEKIDGKLVTDAAFEGDEAAIGALATIGTHLGVALSSLANVFAPDVIVIGGGVSRAGELLIGPARDEMARRALPPMNETKVALAALGPDAGMIGAAVMALDEAAKAEKE